MALSSTPVERSEKPLVVSCRPNGKPFMAKWQTFLAKHNEHIAEALIWASLAASALKRFLAHAAEHLLEVVISTRKAAMPSAYDLPALCRALRHGDGPWYRRAFKAMIHYLGRNARRAHPERDARTGRC